MAPGVVLSVDVRAEVQGDRVMSAGTLGRRLARWGLPRSAAMDAGLHSTIITTAPAAGQPDQTYLVVHPDPQPPSHSPVVLRHLIGLAETRYVLGASRHDWHHAQHGRGADVIWRRKDRRPVSVEYDTGTYGPRARDIKMSAALRLEHDLIWSAPSLARLTRVRREATALTAAISDAWIRLGGEACPGAVQTRLVRWDAGSAYTMER